MTIFGCAGRIFDYVKVTQLEAKWQQRKLDFIAPETENNKIQKNNFFKQNDEMVKAATLDRIVGKMKTGKRLSHDEMEYLRKHAPGLYTKAVKIEKEREELRQALRNCKTKEEAKRVQAAKALQLQAEAKAVHNNKDGSSPEDLEFIGMRMMAMFDEFAEFVKSSEYEEMPNEHEIDDEEQGEHQNKRKFKKSKALQSYEMQKHEIKDAYLHILKPFSKSSNSQNEESSEKSSLHKSSENKVYA
ncbi:MAG: hypothetical protein FWC26_08000 [Fibromonadales bacterium]|nr:hypothetical protein [Fibromonadales bacterium]